MPRPTGSAAAYRPGLDGIRALAVAGVIAYHLGAPWMPGGLLGVGVFFTLSGYLITSILLRTWERHGGMRLGRFWLARARRLLPAVFLMLAAVLLATVLIAPAQAGDRWWQVVFAAAYVANWADIGAGDSYFAATAPLGPLDHLWSLAIEEQFYLVWPLVLWGLLRLARGRRAIVGGVTVALAAVSFALLWFLAQPGVDNTRAYEGTDTRAGALLVGAAVAIYWRGGIQDRLADAVARADAASPADASPLRRAPWWLEALGAVGLVTVVTLMATMPDLSISLYRWGILALSLATAALVAAAAHPRSLTGRVLGVAPLRWLGERSYGIYLWHLPVIVFMPIGLIIARPWWGAIIAIAITVALASLSWWLLENPIRTLGFRKAFAFNASGFVAYVAGKKVQLPTPAAAVAMLALTTTVLVAAAVPDARAQGPALAGSVVGDKPGVLWGLPVDEALEDALLSGPTAQPQGAPGTTSCTSVLHVGDSSSMGLVSETSLPDAAERIDAQYRRVGVEDVYLDILGARSIVERYQGEPNARDAITAALENGFEGCFVIAMGLNEAANVAVGGQTGLAERIDMIQELVGGHPTMWVTVRTLRTRGPWADAEMQKMNQALLDGCRRYPTMRVYDWAAEAPDTWYSSDRIHFTSEGDRERAHRIADALAAAFPAGGQRGYECVVASAWGSAEANADANAEAPPP